MPTLLFSGSVGIEHDSHKSTHSFGRKVLLEVDSHKSISTMGSHDSSPDGSVLCVVLEGRSLVDVSNSLSSIVFSGLLVLATLDVDQSLVFILMSLASSESNESSFHVESAAHSDDHTLT